MTNKGKRYAKRKMNGYEYSLYPQTGGRGYTAAIWLGYKPDGKPNRPTLKAQTVELLEAKLDKKTKELAMGVQSKSDYTVRDAVLAWFEVQCDELGWAPGTRIAKMSHINNHIIPFLGKVKVADLSAKDHVRPWLKERAATAQLSTDVLNQILSILTRTMQLAKEDDYVGRNVCEGMKAPKSVGKHERPSKAMSKDQFLKVFATAMESDLWIAIYILIGLGTGFRTEEIRALDWSVVDFENEVIYVVTSDRYLGKVKTVKAKRGTEMPTWLVKALRRHWEAEGCPTGGLILNARKDGKFVTANQVGHAFIKLCAMAKVKGFAPRELRHTFLNLLRSEGVSLTKLAEIAAHTSSKTTEKYYLDQPEVTHGSAAIMNELVAAS